MKTVFTFLFFILLSAPLFAGVSTFEDDTVSSDPEMPAAKPKQKKCPPADKNAKIVSAIQFFDHIRDNEGCRNIGPDRLTILEDSRNKHSIEDDLAMPHSILFHCDGKPTLASNADDEAFMFGGSVRFENNSYTESYFSNSQNKTVSTNTPYKVISKKPYAVDTRRKKLEFRRVRIKETGENAIEMTSKDYPTCPDGKKERALLLPLQVS